MQHCRNDVRHPETLIQLFYPREAQGRKCFGYAISTFSRKRGDVIRLEVSLDGCLVRPAFDQYGRLRCVGAVPFVPQASFVLGLLKAREIINQSPESGYMTTVENWRQLPDGQIEFTMRRLPMVD
jgi:hypothetical protein